MLFNQKDLQWKHLKRNPKALLVPESPFFFTTTAINLSWVLGPSGITCNIFGHERDLSNKDNSNLRLSPGTDVEVNVVPQVTLTTEDAINKFSPADRGCYACEEAKFRFMPGDPGKYLSELVFGQLDNLILSPRSRGL